ncbi:hypothetical protein F2P81_002771 [Scophthalmus maximus]|uniref:Uncharacterized protein n=1 Tax=Scophthalmus maximus TaxID=52904 RepID=A0A6A4TW22_SCOMX|nr:hypothetical protein F2P81_002771 [Scophthalmus maximus]
MLLPSRTHSCTWRRPQGRNSGRQAERKGDVLKSMPTIKSTCCSVQLIVSTEGAAVINPELTARNSRVFLFFFTGRHTQRRAELDPTADETRMSCTNSNDGAGTRPNARSLPHSSTLETPAAESLAQYAFEKLTHDVTQTQHNAAELQQQLKPQLDLINSQTSTGAAALMSPRRRIAIKRTAIVFWRNCTNCLITAATCVLHLSPLISGRDVGATKIPLALFSSPEPRTASGFPLEKTERRCERRPLTCESKATGGELQRLSYRTRRRS